MKLYSQNEYERVYEDEKGFYRICKMESETKYEWVLATYTRKDKSLGVYGHVSNSLDYFKLTVDKNGVERNLIIDNGVVISDSIIDYRDMVESSILDIDKVYESNNLGKVLDLGKYIDIQPYFNNKSGKPFYGEVSNNILLRRFLKANEFFKRTELLNGNSKVL